MSYYVITMRNSMGRAQIRYVSAPTRETAQRFAQNQADAYGCSAHTVKAIQYHQIPYDFDKGTLLEITDLTN